MQQSDMLRYCLWLGIAATAEGNRRQYHMTTTWLPHFLTNTVALLLPDVYRRVAPCSGKDTAESSLSQRDLLQTLNHTITRLVCENPRYVMYVAPLAAGYLLSSPWLNIYKGELGDLEIAGFGLDAFPHSATAAALTALVGDTLQTAAESIANENALAPLLRWSADHSALVSATVLALVTLFWEVGEYRIYKHEMAQRGAREKINMQWSLRDTLYDCASNAIGWGVMTAWRRRVTR